MRWDDVFADLETAAAGLQQRERDAEIADRTRAELAGIEIADRFRATLGRLVSVRVMGLGVVTGRVQRVAGQWTLLESADVEWLLAWPAVTGVAGLSAQAVEAPASHVERALGRENRRFIRAEPPNFAERNERAPDLPFLAALRIFRIRPPVGELHFVAVDRRAHGFARADA